MILHDGVHFFAQIKLVDLWRSTAGHCASLCPSVMNLLEWQCRLRCAVCTDDMYAHRTAAPRASQ